MAGQEKMVEFFVVRRLSALALGLNVCAVSGLGRWLLQGAGGDTLGTWLLLGLLAAGMLGGTVKWVMRQAQSQGVTA